MYRSGSYYLSNLGFLAVASSKSFEVKLTFSFHLWDCVFQTATAHQHILEKQVQQVTTVISAFSEDRVNTNKNGNVRSVLGDI